MNAPFMQSHEHIRDVMRRLYGGDIPFNEACGFRYLQALPSDTKVVLPWAEHIGTKSGMVSPSAFGALIDVCAGQTALSALNWQCQVATSSIQISHIVSPTIRSDLLAEGQLISCDDHTALIAVRVRSQAAPESVVCEAKARLVVVGRDIPSGSAQPSETLPPAGFLLDIEQMCSEWRGSTLVGRLASSAHFRGNQLRGALHGGLVAGVLYEAIGQAGRRQGDSFDMLDCQVDFVRPAQDRELRFQSELSHTGSRIAFARAAITQESPGKGEVLIAMLNASLYRKAQGL